MKSRDTGFLILGFVVAFLLTLLPKFLFPSEPQRAPALAGQRIPDETFKIDFAKRYNIGTNDITLKGVRSYENVRILGYTGGRDDGESGVASGSKFAHFDQWLVIELIDKRRAYLPLRNVEYLEEVSTSK